MPEEPEQESPEALNNGFAISTQHSQQPCTVEHGYMVVSIWVGL